MSKTTAATTTRILDVSAVRPLGLQYVHAMSLNIQSAVGELPQFDLLVAPQVERAMAPRG